jgi:DNA helicase-2/ATP-dependent DNA helicase PcrA
MALDLEKLNKEQKEAVMHEKGPLLIVAGAGTGKTTVITQRIAYLIEKGSAKPDEILAVTFTEKAAEEMEERVDSLLPYGYVDLWVMTFHSFCERVLRDHALDIGLPSDFKVLDETAGWILVRQNMDKFNLDYYRPLGNPTKFIQALLSHFSHCKDQEIYPEDYLEYAEKLKTRDDLPESQEAERIKEVAGAYHVYQKLLLENGYLDFGDLINYCLKLFKKRPLILESYRKKFKYVLVDEFQDTNWSQYELVKMVAAPKKNLTVCADDDQAIYRWRGASFSNIIQFKKDFPKAKQVSLVTNYRSAQDILDLAYGFIKGNDPDRLEYVNKINKKLVADNKQKGLIEHIKARDAGEEVKRTVEKVLKILEKDKKASFSDIAILVRANSAASPFIKALERAGIPYQFLASKGLYSKPVILDVISYFKLLDNFHESAAAYRILNMPFLEMPYEDILRLTQYARRKAVSLFEAMEESSLIPGLSEKAAEKVSFLLSLIKKHAGFSREKLVSEMFLSFLSDSGYLKYLVKGGKQEQLDMLNQFYKKIKSFEESSLEPLLKNFMEELSFELESGGEGKLEFDSEQGPDVVKVMTVHGAKGLEFKYVFLVNMVDKRFPTIERKDLIEVPEEMIKDIKPEGDVHLQEERRICYVAMTRAKKELYFTSAEDYGLARKKKISRFLIEMGYKDKSQPKKEKTVSDFALKNQKTPKREEIFLPKHFSFSQLAAFEKCPLQYKFNFILKVPIKEKAVFSFGKTMHKTFHDFLKLASESSFKQTDLFGSKEKNKEIGFEDLASLYEKDWIGDWYESKVQKEEYYKLGKKIIKDFYHDFEKSRPEILKINGSLALEIPFNLKIGGSTLFGIIDRIDEKDGEVEIIDYKTGNAKEKLAPEDKEQLLIYQMAAEEVFSKKPLKLTYYYLNSGTKVSFLGTEKEKEKMKEKIEKEIEKIKKSDFKPTPGWQCSFCDFRDICEYAQRQ